MPNSSSHLQRMKETRKCECTHIELKQQNIWMPVIIQTHIYCRLTWAVVFFSKEKKERSIVFSFSFSVGLYQLFKFQRGSQNSVVFLDFEPRRFRAKQSEILSLKCSTNPRHDEKQTKHEKKWFCFFRRKRGRSQMNGWRKIGYV